MILVTDLSGVFFNKGLTLSVEILSKKYNLDPKKVRFVLNGTFAEKYRTGLVDTEVFWQEVKKELDIDNIEEFRQIFFDAYTPQQPYLDLIANIRKQGIKVAYLSNNPEDRVGYLDEKFGFISLFDFGLFSCEAHVRKPAKSIYEKFLDKFNLKGENIIYVDDKEENLVPAKELGMKTIHFVGEANMIRSLKELSISI